MDEQVHKKNSILNELQRKKNEGSLTQAETVDLKQEMEKCNHIMNHIIRGYVNPAGKWAATAVFGGVGFCYWLSSFSNKSRIFTIKNSLMFVPYVLIPIVFSIQFAKRRLGDRKEAKRFSQQRDNSMEADEKFYEILDTLNKSDLKY